MKRLSAPDLLVFVAFLALVLDSRRFRALARSTGQDRRRSVSGRGIPAGASPEQVGLPLRQIQMRIHVDWQDGGIGWQGPEVLPVNEPEDAPVGENTTAPGAEPNRSMPVLWTPFPALPQAGATGCWPHPETPVLSSPESWFVAFDGGPPSLGRDGPAPPDTPAEPAQRPRPTGARQIRVS
jgi:hypothetical protein